MNGIGVLMKVKTSKGIILVGGDQMEIRNRCMMVIKTIMKK